ncbi:unnamed protein product [Clonostachys rosea f. rosea IK726]|uniref:Deacetylase sirtuin-type domain-containing protein n=2 Tax=Bionectria ochroleuca TaxID=29856 RepID=A0A0B7K1J8_BIOOC|nr:unnamed protein product [Clonostachys rosea f. rosea IK726]
MSDEKQAKIQAFHKALLSSRRIIALCGAGLSAPSGLETYRGPGGLWKKYDVNKLSTATAFRDDPSFVWLLYANRRHTALKAEPNNAHRALAALALERPEFLCMTQNVDDLSRRANHPLDRLLTLHGSLFNLKCTICDWVQKDNFDDPICPALAPASTDHPGGILPLMGPGNPIGRIEKKDLPKCPQCPLGLQRPDVVWFGEKLDINLVRRADNFVDQEPLDMMLVIGTSALVWPAAGYIGRARGQGARIVTIDLTAEDPEQMAKMEPGDLMFAGDASELLPLLLEPVIGKMQTDGTFVEE